MPQRNLRPCIKQAATLSVKRFAGGISEGKSSGSQYTIGASKHDCSPKKKSDPKIAFPITAC
jgi:hypothetical protein